MKEMVSIIIPTYNGEKYIKETIDSCLSQTYKELEIIVIDDCSNDSTVKILKEYGNKINLYLNKTNQGISKNINKGVKVSKGKYFIFLGHDDLLPKNHIEIMIKEFNNNDIVSVHCNSFLIDSNGNKIGFIREDYKQFKKTDNCLFELSLDNFISSCGTVSYTHLTLPTIA
jgi:glycosyltransferase involved in cell wall biosynthesis